jgi:hypothetical protein
MGLARRLSLLFPVSVMLVATLGLPGSASVGETATTSKQPEWSVEGEWTDTCSCQIPCPCWIKGMPTLGHCSEMF